MKVLNRKSLKAAFPLTLPVMAGYVFLGFSFGLLMIGNGAPAWVPVLMSVAIYSGALEFAAAPFFFQAFQPLTSFFFGFLLSIRHMFYGIPMLKKYADAGKLKPLMIFWLTDETFSISVAQEAPEGVDATGFYAWIGLLHQSYWVGGTLLGAVLGSCLPFDLTGIDFVLTALFLVLLLEQMRGKTGVFGGGIGLFSAIAALAVVGSDSMVLAAVVLILALLFAGRRVVEHAD